MNILRRTVMAIGGMTVVALVIALAAPRTAHGIVATLVQVTNTSANPVPTVAADDPARSSFLIVTGCTFSNSSECIVRSFFSVPTTQIAVVEFISSQCSVNIGTQAALFVDYPGVDVNAGRIAVPFNSAEAVNLTGFATLDTSMNTRAYAGSGSWDAIWITSSTPSQGNFCSMTMSGHYVNR